MDVYRSDQNGQYVGRDDSRGWRGEGAKDLQERREGDVKGRRRDDTRINNEGKVSEQEKSVRAGSGSLKTGQGSAGGRQRSKAVVKGRLKEEGI